MATTPTHQVNVSRKGPLCAPDSGKFFETPCIDAKKPCSGIYSFENIHKHGLIERYRGSAVFNIHINFYLEHAYVYKYNYYVS